MDEPEILRIVIYADAVEENNAIVWDTDNRYYRLGISLSEMISQALGLRYRFLFPTDGEFGRLANGNWTGMVGLVYRGEADLVVSELAMTDARIQALDFSYPFTISDVTFVTQKPQFISDITSVLEPFSWEVWSFFAFYLIVMPCVHYFWFQGTYKFSKIVLDIFSTFLGQQVFKKSRRTSERILILFWTIPMMIMSIVYRANLLSILTFPTLQGVRYIPELAEEVLKGTYDCVTYSGSYYAESMIESGDKTLQAIGQNLLAKEGNSDIEEVLHAPGSKIPAFVGPEPDFMHLKNKHFISEDLFFIEIPAIGMSKDFCCKKRLDTIIHRINAAGLYEKILEDERRFKMMQNLSGIAEEDESTVRPLSLMDVRSAFIFSLVGYLASVVCFLLELVIGRINSKMNQIRDSRHICRKMKMKTLMR